MPAPNSITATQLSRLIGTPDCPHIVDICIDPDFADDPHLIPGSFRHPHTDIPGLKQRLDGQPAIIACQKGLKLSQGLTSWLRADGLRVEYLIGGVHAWRDLLGAPRIPATAIPAPIDGATLWVTRHRPRIDRIACPWLIRRFVDGAARVLFVAPSEVANVAARFNATPFDIDGVPWSHHGGNCTFDTMLDTFHLHTPALDTMATIIRTADTNRHDLAPQAAGLLALSVGLSRQYRDDHQQMQAGFALYDALYRWARDGQSETHDWDKESAR